MAGIMDMFGGGDIYGDLLTDEQKQRMQQQTMMTMAAKLLQAGGPSTTPTSLGQALGGAFLSGQEAYGTAGQNAVQGMLTKQKIEDYQAEKKQTARIREMLLNGGNGSGGVMTPSMALAAGGPASLGVGPTNARAATIGQPAPVNMGGGPFAGINPSQMMLMAMSDPSKVPGMAALFAQQNRLQGNSDREFGGRVTSRLTPEEVKFMGLPSGTVAQRDGNGQVQVLRNPSIQVVTTPDGGTSVINLDTFSSGRSGGSPGGSPSGPPGGRPTPSLGGSGQGSVANLFDPSMKPGEIIVEERDWSKNYYQPVQAIMKNYADVMELINSGQGGISDYGILIKAIKALDPTSAVMQGEADSAKQMMSLGDRMSSILKQAQSGGLGSDVAREQLANLARTSVKTAIASYNSQLARKSEVYSTARMPADAIKAILAPVESPLGIDSVETMRQQIQPKSSQYPPNVMDAIQNGANVQSDGKGNFIYLDPQTNTWKPIQ